MTGHRTPGPGLARTPPMGWNSFNTFGCEPTEALIMEAADALVSTGLRDAGYVYINIDDGWMTTERDSSGNLTVDPAKFPNGLRHVTDYVHSRGLKIGTYLGAGLRTYGEKMGSLGHARADALFICEAGFDLLKYDYRDLPEDPPGRDVRREYEEMRDYLIEAGRPMMFSICEHGRSRPWEWGASVGHLCRTTPDIKDGYDGDIKWGWGFNKIVDMNERLYPFAAPGFWNDPDMLIVGMKGRVEWQGSGCTDEEYRSHFALWCLMASPLFIGCDIRNMDADTRAILLNKNLVAVNQDVLGIQGHVLRREKTHDVWIKKLSGDSVAIGLYNRSLSPVDISVTWSELGFSSSDTLVVRDLWQDISLDRLPEGLRSRVAAHDCLVYRISK